MVSIATMVALASLVVVALTITGPTMRKTLNNSLNTYNHPDIIIRSSHGLDYEDELILKRDKDIDKLAMVKTSDLIEDDNLIRLKSYNKYITKSVITNGRMPENKNEIALDTSLSDKYKIGDKLKFSYVENSNIDEKTMNNMSYKLVGFFKTSDYFMEDMKALSYTAKKEIDGYAYVLEDNFATDKFGEANIIYKQTKDLDKNSNNYQNFVNKKDTKIKKDIENRPREVLKTIKKDANSQLDDAQDDINKAKDELNKNRNELDDARDELDKGYRDYEQAKYSFNKQISDGESQLEKSRIELIDGQNKLDQAKLSYRDNLRRYNSEIESAENEIIKKEKDLKRAESDLEKRQSQIDDGYDKLSKEYDEPSNRLQSQKVQLDNFKKEIDKKSLELEELINYQNRISDESKNSNIEDSKFEYLQEQIENLNYELDIDRQEYENQLVDYQLNQEELSTTYAKEKSSLDKSYMIIDKKKAEIDQAYLQLKEAKRELYIRKSDGKTQLESASDEINQRQSDIDQGWTDYNKGIEELNFKKTNGREELKKSYQKLLDGEDEYQNNLANFKENENNALNQINEGEDEIAENRDNLARLYDPIYDVETIYDNEGINTYYQNSLNMDELTKIFPSFFYLVAMLVTLTTMKRYIDEQRNINGILKSLGYRDSQVSQRFYIYGIIPTLIGSIIGAILARFIVTDIIVEAYSTGFANLSIDYVNAIPYIIFAVLLSTLLIALTIYITSKKTISDTPADLLRPKTPDSGKKILLERIGIIWRKLSFMQKITARNIFRYKSRIFMTLFGVAGCTALTFFGFAMIDSIKDTVDYQQNQISHYDLIALLDEKAKDEQVDEFKESIKGYSSMPIRLEDINIDKNGKSRDISLIIAELDNINDFFTLRNPDASPIDLSSEEALISEKASNLLDIKANDRIKLEYDDISFDLNISNIIENYTGDYIFVSKDKFKDLSKKSPKINAYYLKGDVNKIIDSIEDEPALNATIDASVIYASMDSLMDNLNLVIAVITLISVLLALVVLYNLININVSERKRELATIKVLGFYPREVTSYIFREIFILTLLGILVGYVLGYAMFRYIIYIVAPKDILLSYRVHPSSFLLSGGITIAISLVLLFVVHKNLKKIDMAEAMSSGE